ncbi:MAG: outer membrane protein, partial [Paracoccaceae bacterium]
LSYNEDTSDGSNDILITGQPPFSSPIDDTTETEQIRIELNVPLFSGGRVSASRRQAYEQYNATLQQSIYTQRQVVQQIRSLHLTVSTDVQRIKARKQGIVSAESALDATKAGYEVGTRNIVDVLQAQRSLFAAIRDYANARFEYVLNMLKLKQQAGTLSPEDVYNLDKWLAVKK